MCLYLFLIVSSSLISAFHSATTELVTIYALKGRPASIPCHIIFRNGATNATLVFWYKDGDRHPLYSIDGRDDSIYTVTPVVPDEFENRLRFDLLNVPPQLHINSVLLSDGGIYNCRVDYRYSRTMYHRSKLSVIELPGQPVIKDKYGEVIPDVAGPFNEGEPLALICESEGGNPLPKLQWFRGNKLIDSSDRVLQGGIIKNELLLGSLKRSFNGNELSCEARNTNLTEGLRTNIKIAINLRPDNIQMADIGTLVADETYIIWCNTTGAKSNVVITWSIDSQKLLDMEIFEDNGIVSSLLRFTPSFKDHSKQLTCKAYNPLIENSEVEESQNLRIQYTPRLSLGYYRKNSDNNEINEGDDVRLYCIVSANPPIQYLTWMFNDMQLSRNSISGKMENLTYTLKNVSYTATGLYSCKARNSLGENQSKDIFIQVRHSPRCTKRMVVTYLSENPSRYEIKCQVSANPSSVVFHWWLEKILGANKTVLQNIRTNSMISVATVNKTLLLQFDRILCSAENISGKQKRPCVLQINPNEPPSIPKNCSILHATSTAVYVRCNVDDNPSIRQSYHMDIYNSENMVLVKNMSSESPQFNATNLPPNINLRITLYNKNARGKSEMINLKYTANSKIFLKDDNMNNLMDEKPMAAILTGMIAGLLMVLCVILAVIKLRRRCNRCEKSRESSNGINRKTEKSSSEEMCSSKDGQSPDLIPLHKSVVKVDEKPIFIIDSEHSIKYDIDSRHFSELDRYEDSVRKKPQDGHENYVIEELVEEPKLVIGQTYGNCCGLSSVGDRKTVSTVIVPSFNHHNQHEHEELDSCAQCSDYTVPPNSYHIKCADGGVPTSLGSPSRRYKLESSV